VSFLSQVLRTINVVNSRCGKGAQRDYRELLKYDQLSREMRQNNFFKSFKEGTITFPPTFKYDLGRDVYDTSDKRRCPAWTDRVLYQQVGDADSKDMINLNEYMCVQYCRHSDHRPVIARFEVDFCDTSV
jgi:hypothetical protein